MAHLDDDELTLYSFGEATPDVSRLEHLRTCVRCDAELAARTRLVRVGRSLRDVELVRPPDSVWKSIHDELGLSPELRDVPRDPAPAIPATADVHHVGRDRRRGRRSGRLTRDATLGLVAAAGLVVGLLAGVAGTVVLSRPDAPLPVAEADLEPFPGWTASGSARVEEDNSGAQHIVVDVSAPGQGLREVWLIDPDTSGLISLGLLSGTTGTFALPDDLDLARYSVVDISQEPDDGDPAHSGDSIVRGALHSI
ncbi:MAG: anti-sigma factor [Leifsonia flava]